MDPAASAFLIASGSNGSSYQKPQIEIYRSKTGLVKGVFGKEFGIDLLSLPCSSNIIVGNCFCFFEVFGDHFGISSPQLELRYKRINELPEGKRVIWFSQIHNGHEIIGRGISLLVDRNDQLLSVHSYLALPLVETLTDTLSTPPPSFNTSNALNQISEMVTGNIVNYDLADAVAATYARYSKIQNLYLVDTITLAKVINIKTLEINGFVILNDEDGSLINYIPVKSNYDGPGVDIYAQSKPAGMTYLSAHDVCQSGSDCSVNEFCASEFSPSICIQRCTDHDICQDYSEYYGCMADGGGEFDGYCTAVYETCTTSPCETNYFQLKSRQNESETWYNGALSNHAVYKNLNILIEAVMSFHLDTLNVWGWDNEGSKYYAELVSQCDHASVEEGEMIGLGGCNYLGSADTGGTAIAAEEQARFRIFSLNHYTAIDQSTADIVGHEMGHNITGIYAEGNLGTPAMESSYRYLTEYGSSVPLAYLFRAFYFGLEPTEQITCGGSFFQVDAFSWQSYASGLEHQCSPSVLLPYPHRSRFDWFQTDHEYEYTTEIPCQDHSECRNYEWCSHHGFCGSSNRTNDYQEKIMGRFLKILIDGAGSLHSELTRENLDIPDSPVPFYDAAAIIYYAIGQINNSSTLYDWLYDIRAMANSYGYLEEVDNALGAVGYFPKFEVVENSENIKGAVSVKYSSWQNSTNKEFLFWNTGNDTIALKYMYGAEYVVKEITDIVTSSRPSVVERGGNLHVYFVDGRYDGWGPLQVVVIDPTGDIDGPYYLNGSNDNYFYTLTDSFDSVEFNGSVYLVYNDYTNDMLMTISRCDATSYCTTGGWHQFASGEYSAVISSEKARYISLASASNINGLEISEEWLLIASSNIYSDEISVSFLNSTEDISNFYQVPDYYPSYKTGYPFDIRVQDSAYPQQDSEGWVPRRYPYLVWKDVNTNRIHISVLQNANPEELWFTRSIYTEYVGHSLSGVSWVQGSTTDNMTFLYGHQYTNNPTKAFGYGKY
jgi:hypothetical protein